MALRKLVYSGVTTVDGFIAGPDGQIDWIPADDELHRHFAGEFARADSAFVPGIWDNCGGGFGVSIFLGPSEATR